MERRRRVAKCVADYGRGPKWEEHALLRCAMGMFAPDEFECVAERLHSPKPLPDFGIVGAALRFAPDVSQRDMHYSIRMNGVIG
eukprot:973708-Pyramimonas_sp.AAC.1